MKRTLLFILSFFCFSNLMFGQKYVFSKPNKLTYNRAGDSEEAYPILSMDGTVLYFVKTFAEGNIGGKSGGQDIWSMRRDSLGIWETPTNLIMLNNASNNVVVGRSNTDSILYLMNTYSNPNRWNYGIAYSTQTNNGWGKPKELNLKFGNKGFFRGYYITPEEDVVLVSTEDKSTYGKEDLYIYRKENDEWAEPIHLDSMINTEGVEMSPFLTGGGETLFFSSDGHKGYGDMDIFMSKRLDDTWENWSPAVNIGKEINSSGFDAYLSTYKNGEVFFISNQAKNAARIYSSTLTIVEEEVLPPIDTVIFYEPQVAVQKVIKTEPEIEPEPTISITPQKSIEGYTVQVIAVPTGREPTGDFFQHVDMNLLNMTSGKDGLDRFYVGEYLERNEAATAMKLLRNFGYEDAFVRKLEMYNQL